MSTKQPKEQLFLEWLAEQYDVGVPDATNFNYCIAYIEGLAHGGRTG